jgi:hypothetical protein
MTARFAAMTLALESLVVFFATLVASRLSSLEPTVVWVGGSGLALACLLSAAFARRRRGLVVGSLVQVLVLGTGVLVPAMFVLGGIFVAMWVWLLLVGRRIDRDRAAWESAEHVSDEAPDRPSDATDPPAREHVDG